jgi:hypothetical protein
VTGARILPSRQIELKALDLLCSHIDCILPPCSPERYDSRPYALALDLALKYNKADSVQKILHIVGSRIVGQFPHATRELALAPRTGQIVCRDPSIQRATGLTIERARVISSELADALRIRLYSGEPRPHLQLSWASLLAEIQVREAATKEEGHDTHLPFLLPPATPDEIKLAESELGISLPHDYKVCTCPQRHFQLQLTALLL